MSIYLKSGYINQKWIEETADKNNISFIIEIGGRQVGKTYGTLKLALDEHKTFILMRRTQSESEFICNPINNPFTVFAEKNITIKKDSKYTASINETEIDKETNYIGEVMALSTVAKIRGFNGRMYTDLIFDEFIPETHVQKIKNEGDAFLNAIVTISGAREEEGEKPLRVWLLANANTLKSPILDALNVSDKIENMKTNYQEISILKDRGIMIILPDSRKIMEKRKENAIFKAVGTESNFSRMALGNEFSYNDTWGVGSKNLKQFVLLMQVGDMYIYKHKSKSMFYVSKNKIGEISERYKFNLSESDKRYVSRHFADLRAYYINKLMFFETLTIKIKMLDFLF